MKRLFYSLLLFAVATILFTACRKKAFDEYYGRPDNLAAPIYQQLESKGNFLHLLKLIDKSGYKQTLSGAGYWTFFAPNDGAFATFFTDRGISGVDAIDSSSARNMVQFLLVYNAYKKERLDDYQATASANAGWQESSAFRRRTAYYTGFYKDTGVNNRTFVALANNRNTNAATAGYVSTDYNNKHIPYFIDDYFAARNLSAADYNYFYPNSTYSGFNVAQANVVTKDILAENGIIHEVDKVITPLLSIDEYIRSKPEYSVFKAMLNRLYLNNMVTFTFNADATSRYRLISKTNDSVFIKVYSNLLTFSPNNENFLKAEDNDAQRDCWTMFIPRNEAVTNYVNTVLCQHYPSLDEMPIQIIADFLNSHLFPTAVWPTQFATTRNNAGEEARFDPAADVFDKQFLSNGIVYGVNKVMEPNAFRTVFGKVYLDNKYQFMTRILDATGLKIMVSQPSIPVTMFLIPDKVFADSGYSYNVTSNTWSRTTSAGTTSNGIFDALSRIVRSCVFQTPYRSMIEDLSGNGVVKSGENGTEGEYIKFDNFSIQTGGLSDFEKWAHVDSSATAINGKVYYLNDLPSFSNFAVGYHIRQLGTPTTSEYNYFWRLLSTSSIFTSNTNVIAGIVGSFYTILVPTNNAVKQAVIDGVIPGNATTGEPSFNPGASEDKLRIANFIQYHFINNRTIIPDGQVEGVVESVLKNPLGNGIRLTVYNEPGNMQVIDVNNRAANVIVSQSNHLSNRAVIHLIDNYLKQ